MNSRPSLTPTTIRADRVYVDGRFERDLVLTIGPDGRIAGIEPGAEARLDLAGRALIPGFVNLHSHAFQRGLRGRTSAAAGDRPSHFWSWRERMYELVAGLEADAVYALSLRAFREMAAAGYTCVAEFHYLHNDTDGRPYDDPNRLARRVIEAAREAGLRIVLLNTFYERGGLRDEPLAPAQQRFAGGDPGAFVERTARLAESVRDEEAVGVGLAVHSVRAVRPDSMSALFEAAAERDWPVHVHLSEQVSEVEACREVYGRTPIELVADRGGLGPRTTGVHCTHITEDEIELLAGSGATVCGCPTTEADLGDGLLRAEELRARGVPIGLGSDSQARIDPFEEMRAVEYHERLRHRRRNVLVGAGRRGGLGAELLEMATAAGARALGLPAGRLAPGAWADLVALDLGHPLLAGWTDPDLASLIATAADPRIVDSVFVAGRRII